MSTKYFKSGIYYFTKSQKAVWFKALTNLWENMLLAIQIAKEKAY